ncbi:MAG: DNA-binding protein WhiA [Lachnospiraceae bacterium]|nr:DNA-binding protein WhiA [Lachnospiraceae bacterium]
MSEVQNSFSENVHSELLGILPEARHCMLAELSAMLGYISGLESGYLVVSHTPRRGVLKKCFTLIEKAFNMRFVDLGEKRIFSDPELQNRVVSALRLESTGSEKESLLLKNDCCRHSYLRGAFLCCGTLVDPAKGYRLEFTTRNAEETKVLSFALKEFDSAPSVVERRGRQVVYLKNGGAIADLLTAMGAYVSLMDLENTRILRGVRGDVNRRVNIEAANIEKTVRSAAKQIEDIRYIDDTVGLKVLPGALYETALIRLQNPDASLVELGKLMDRPVSKSAMNHRMQRISDTAERLRKEGGDSAVKRSKGKS